VDSPSAQVCHSPEPSLYCSLSAVCGLGELPHRLYARIDCCSAHTHRRLVRAAFSCKFADAGSSAPACPNATEPTDWCGTVGQHAYALWIEAAHLRRLPGKRDGAERAHRRAEST